MPRSAPVFPAFSVAVLVAAIAFAVAAPIGVAHAQSGRQVETQTIIVPEGERVMPEIPADDAGGAATDAATAAAAAANVPDVLYDQSALPEPVRRMREEIMAAAATGDLEQLRAVIDAGPVPPALSFGDVAEPIDYLRSLSGDPEGREILAILIEVLEAGFVHVAGGNEDEMYVWPYFARYPVDALTPRQIVELFKLVYAGDYEDMKAYGYYLSYRVGIAPDGTWRYFIAGD